MTDSDEAVTESCDLLDHAFVFSFHGVGHTNRRELRSAGPFRNQHCVRER